VSRLGTIRPRRVVAVAWRDLRQELKGRQGLFVPAVLVSLMLPTAALKPGERTPGFVDVTGDVPIEVLALDRVRERDVRTAVRFDREEDGALVVTSPSLRPRMREVLDEVEPEEPVQITWLLSRIQAPHRGLLLALIAASSLTGPVSSSVGTERSRGTLTALLTASVTRGELVMGKWLAWGGFGLVSTLSFTAVALVRDVVEPGWWLVAMGSVPLALTAFGLWVVRRASDVVSATATALRLQPAALMVCGLVAFVLGDVHPLLGAAVPIGGALLTAGDVWPDAATTGPLVGAASSLALCAALLWSTARDLSEKPPETPLAAGWTGATLAAAGGALTLWTPLIGPELWRQAGNPGLTERLSIDVAVWGAAAALLGWATLRATQHLGDGPLLDLRRPRPAAWLGAAAAGLVLGLSAAAFGALTDPTSMIGALSVRLGDTFVPAGVGPAAAVALVVAEEVMFRGILARQTGAVPASTAWALVKAPLDPFAALVGGSLLAGVSRVGGLAASLLCRLVALAVVGLVPVPASVGAALGLVGAAVAAAVVWRTDDPTPEPIAPSGAGAPTSR